MDKQKQSQTTEKKVVSYDTIVKEMRAKTGLSQSQFAAYFGMPKRTLQDWEQGKRTPPGYMVSMMERILIAERGFKDN